MSDDAPFNRELQAPSHQRPKRKSTRTPSPSPTAEAYDGLFAIYSDRLSHVQSIDFGVLQRFCTLLQDQPLPIDTLHSAFAALHDQPLRLDTLQRVCAKHQDSPRPSSQKTPPHQHLHLPQPLPSPTPQRTIKIAAEASRTVDQDAWRACRYAVKSVRRVQLSEDSEDPAELDVALYSFLHVVRKHQRLLQTMFDRIAACDLSDEHLDSYFLAPVRDAFVKVTAWIPKPSDDQVLAYVLLKFPPPPHRHAEALAALSGNGDNAALEDLKLKLETSIRRSYLGDAHNRLLRFAIKVNDSLKEAATYTPAPYWKGTPVVQSSGTGKTRLVLQLGNIAPLLFVCIRPPKSRPDQGYPLADDDVVRFLQDTAHANRDNNTIAAAFLAAWFDVLAQDLEEELQGASSAEVKHRFLLDLNAYGTRDKEDKRRLFFRRVAIRAEQNVAQAPSHAQNHRDMFAAILDAPVERLSKQLRPVQSYLAAKSKADTTDLGDDDAQLPHIFVAIDECVNLGVKLLESFRRAWNHIGTLEARNDAVWWLLLTSTSSGAASLVRPSRDAASLREVAIPSMPTFFGVGFDTLRAEQPVLEHAIDATKPSYAMLFGRPMWASLLERSFWATAIFKLIGATKFVPGNRDMCFSIVASRLALRYVPLRGAGNEVFVDQNNFAHKAVDRHMRLLTGVHADSALQISSPSEPILAIAAALLMLPTDEERRQDQAVRGSANNRYGSILETLKLMCSQSQTIDVFKGTRGELVARLLWMAASDAALVAKPPFVAECDQTPDDGLRARAERHLKPVAVDVLLAKLIQLGADDQAQVQQRIDEVCKQFSQKARDPASAAQAEVRAWTHFSHFDILEMAIDEISPEFLWYCWKRGVAVQLAHSQHGIDGLIPVFIGDLDRPFGHAPGHADETQAESHMTYIAWEAKNRSKTHASLAHKAAARDKHAGPVIRSDSAGSGEPLTQRSLLTVLADVGAAYSEASVAPIGGTGALQIWIRGTDNARVYPCLDELDIRNVIVAFVGHISRHQNLEYESENTLLNPMHLDQAVLQREPEPEPEPEPEREREPHPDLDLEPHNGSPDAHEAMNED